MPARKALIPLLFAAALFATGCGGGAVAYEEVDLPPATITVPSDTGTTASADADATATPTTTPTATPDASGGTTSGGTTEDSGAAAPTQAEEAPQDTGGATTPTEEAPQDTGGASPDEGLDQFCADNPGACDGEG